MLIPKQQALFVFLILASNFSTHSNASLFVKYLDNYDTIQIQNLIKVEVKYK